VQDQSLGVKFHVSKPVVARSIGGYFQPYQTDPFVVPSDILGAVVRLHGPHDFPNSFDLTTPDVLATTEIHVSAVAGDYGGKSVQAAPPDRRVVRLGVRRDRR